MRIDDLNLSVRTYNTLLRTGINTVEKIREMTDEDLKSVKNLSEKCYKEIKQAVDCTDGNRRMDG